MKQSNKQLYEALIESREALNQQIYSVLESLVLGDELEKRTFNENGKFICHLCKGARTCKAGINGQGKQKYKCHDCKKEMIIQRNIITFSSKKDFSQWMIFLVSELDGNPLHVSAEKAKISKRTAFRWRHKLQYLLNTLLHTTCLEGIVYIDETLFPVVNKNATIEKEIVKKKRGMSDQKVNVTCGIDIKGNTIIKVLSRGRVTSKELIQTYKGNIQSTAIVVSDSLRSYHQLMSELGVTWEKIPTKKKSVNEHTLDPVNDLHASIKDFTYKYKGISIKYLQGYMALFDFQRKHKQHYREEVLYEIVKQVFTSSSTLRCSDIDSGKTLYP